MSEEIQEFEDSGSVTELLEDPNVQCQENQLQEEGIGVEIADEEEIDFLDGLSELAFLQSGEMSFNYECSYN